MKGTRLKTLGFALLGGLALLFAGCGQQAAPPPQADRVLSVTVTPATAQVEVGGQVALNAQVQVQGNASQAVTWSSSDTAVATVDSNGVVRGVAPGQAIIRATSVADNTKFGQATITVVPQSRPSISILQPANGAVVNGPFQAQVRVQGTQGNLRSLTYTFAGSSPVSILSAGVQPQQYDVTRTFTVNVPENLADGEYQLTVRAEDDLGRSAEASVTVRLRRGPGIQVVLEPADANANLVVLQQNVNGNTLDVPYGRGNIRVRVVVDGRGLNPTRVEIFRGRTEADTSTRLYDGAPGTAQVVDNSAVLQQGEPYFYIARVYFDGEVAPGQNNLTQARLFVPDNLPPQLADIVEVSKLSPASTLAKGNWVNGTFTQGLENLNSLVDNPTGTAFPASGVRAIRYYADRTPFDATFNRDILLGEATVSPYSIQVNTQAALPDGTYRVFAVAVDQVGNESTGPLSAYILNVDNTPPNVTLAARDRGPGDVGTACAGGGNVDLFPADPGFVSGCAVVTTRARDAGVGFVAGTTRLIVSLGGGAPVTFPTPIVAGPNDTGIQNGTVNYDTVNGPVTLTATISDELGNQGQATLQITVDNNRPQAPVITSPSAGTYDAWSQVTFGANASDAQSSVREVRLFFASNAAPVAGVNAPVWNRNGAQPGLVELARIPGASGAANLRLPDPTNEPAGNPNRPLDLIALAVDQGGNVRASFRTLTIRHLAAAPNEVNNPGDNAGNDTDNFELTFLAPPSGAPQGAQFPAHPLLGPEAGLVGQSQYVLSYVETDAQAAIAGGSLARLSFYRLAPGNDPLRSNLGAAAAIGLPNYVALGINEVYYWIQDVESAPYRVNWTLEPNRGLVALIFNDRGHSSQNPDALGAGFMAQVTALACPQGNYSFTANTPLDGVYQIRFWNAAGNVQAHARYDRFSGSAGPNPAFGYVGANRVVGGSVAGPDGTFIHDTANTIPPGGGDTTAFVLGLAAGSTYTQSLLVTDTGGPTTRVFTLCPQGSINVVP